MQTADGVLAPTAQTSSSKDRQRNIAAFDVLSRATAGHFARNGKVGADAPFLFSLLGGALVRRHAKDSRTRQGWSRGHRGTSWFGEALVPTRSYLETTYKSEDLHALWAPGCYIAGLARSRLFR